MSEVLALTSQTPITFFGKVVDQHGNPVAGANVRGNAEMVKRWMGQEWDTHFTTTDDNGRFRFSGLHGQSLVVSPAKDGYEYRSNNAVYEYAMVAEKDLYHPDPNAPVVFKMWKQQGAEPLISGKKFFGIKADGTPFTIDLAKGTKREGKWPDGDLVVNVVQPARINDEQPFDWSFSIEAIDGGVIEARDTQYLNEAPAVGYESQIAHEVKAGEREWSEETHKTFYVKSRNGNQFARVISEIRANYQGAAVFSIRYLVNPKRGSRNLEYDPSKEVLAR